MLVPLGFLKYPQDVALPEQISVKRCKTCLWALQRIPHQYLSQEMNDPVHELLTAQFIKSPEWFSLDLMCFYHHTVLYFNHYLTIFTYSKALLE